MLSENWNMKSERRRSPRLSLNGKEAASLLLLLKNGMTRNQPKPPETTQNQPFPPETGRNETFPH